MTHLSFEPIYGRLWVTILIAVMVVAVISLVTPPTPIPSRRRWLIALRSIAGLVLLVACAAPTLIRTDTRPAPATLVIAADRSRSMSLPDGNGADRWNSQLAVIEKITQGVSVLDEFLDVKLIGYDSSTNTLADASDGEQIKLLSSQLSKISPDGDATDLGSGIQGAINSVAGKPLAGVILVGDGRQTTTVTMSTEASSSSAARQAAEVLGALGVPLWTVPIGPPGTDSSARDVAITGLVESLTLFADNQFELSLTATATGFANRTLPISVTWIDVDGTISDSKSRQFSPRRASESVAINIPMTAPAPGLYRLRVSIKPQSGEWVTNNNSQSAFVEVREGGGRILILEGPGRPEQTFLSRSLSKFPDLEIRSVTIRGNQNWPVPLEAFLQSGRFDIFILGDVDAAAIGQPQLSQLAKRIEQGAGLITLGGYQNYSVGGYADGPLGDALPIKMDPSRRRPSPRQILTPAEIQVRSESHLQGPIKFRVARSHQITEIAGSTDNRVWEQLAPMSSANRFDGVKVRPGVQVLLQTPENDPLLVIGGFGKGRIASLAFDETYRWRREGKLETHRRFWRQLMLWLMSREETTGDRVIAELDSRRFESEAAPQFRARLQLIDREEVDVELSAVVVDEDGIETALEITASGGDDNEISGTLPELPPGFYKLIANANVAGIESDEIAFQVIETGRELAQPMADHVYLKQLADLTASEGGAMYDPTQTQQLVETIKSLRKQAETPVIDRKTLGAGPISGWIVFVLFSGALSIEWLLRRRWGMA